jgi:hypothetical protein
MEVNDVNEVKERSRRNLRPPAQAETRRTQRFAEKEKSGFLAPLGMTTFLLKEADSSPRKPIRSAKPRFAGNDNFEVGAEGKKAPV